MQLSENIKMTNFHLTFLWIFPYNMGNNDRKGADPGMGKVDHNKQQKRESLLDSAFSLFIDAADVRPQRTKAALCAKDSPICSFRKFCDYT